MAAYEELKHRFDYHPAHTQERQEAHQTVRANCWSLANSFLYNLPDGREKSIALTKLEEAMFWANAAIARDPE